MKLTLLLTLALLGTPAACNKAPTTPARESTQIGETLAGKRTDLTEQLAGNLAGAQRVTATLPAGLQRQALDAFLDDSLALTGQPRAETRTRFEALADRLLSDDASIRAAAEARRQEKAAAEQALKAQVATLEAAHAAKLAEERSAHAAELERVRREAEARQRWITTLIFYGGGALCIAAAVALGYFAAYVPFLGPNIAKAVGGTGLALIAVGYAINWLNEHPAVVYTLAGLAVAGLAAAVALAVANRHHAKTTPS